MGILSFFIILGLSLSSFGSTPRHSAPQIEQDPAAQFSGLYIIPNEREYYLYEGVNRARRGAYVGVGTFRVLAGASYGDFDEIVFADLDSRIVEFNNAQIRILKRSSDIEDFLTRIQSWAGKKYKNPLRGAELMASRYGDYLRNLAAKDPSTSFLKDPIAFRKLRLKARTGKMYAVSASLTGSIGIKSLAKHFSENQIEVSVLDVSNAPDYMVWRPETWLSFHENLKSLPFAKDGVINFTTEELRTYNGFKGGGGLTSNDQWSYTSSDARAYTREMMFERSKMGFKNFLLHVRDHHNVTACSRLF